MKVNQNGYLFGKYFKFQVRMRKQHQNISSVELWFNTNLSSNYKLNL